jgi:TonB family protein
MFVGSLLSTSLCAVAILLSGVAGLSLPRAQQTTMSSAPDDLKRGLELYKQGDDEGAIEALRRATDRNKNEVGAWYGLALCYTRQDKLSDARRAYEKAAISGEWLIEQFYSANSITEIPVEAERYKTLLLMAAESAKKYLELSGKLSRPRSEEWNARLEMLRDYAEFSGENSNASSAFRIYKPDELESRARIIGRVEPGYTREALDAKVTGTVVLRAIFAFDGRVRGVKVIKGLPNGLTLAAINAARRIRFIPATVGGKPVSQYVQIEYNFDMH